MRTGTVVFGAGVVLAGALGGCASAKPETPGSAAPGTSAAAPSITVIHESDNGTTVHVKTVGAEVILANFSSLWGVPKPTDAAVVTGPPASAAKPGCATPAKAMGNGCAMSQVVYKAAGKGTTTITAHRDSCGEALRCVGANASDFVITVVVEG